MNNNFCRPRSFESRCSYGQRLREIQKSRLIQAFSRRQEKSGIDNMSVKWKHVNRTG